MASNARVFFAGVGTTFVILAAGFGGGLMLAKTSLELSGPSRSADRLPPVRVVLPTSGEAALPSPTPVEAAVASAAPQPLPASGKAEQAAEKQKQLPERIERRKAEAEERARRKRYAERKAKREAARLAHQQQEQQTPMQAGLVAFGRDDGQSRLFNN